MEYENFDYYSMVFPIEDHPEMHDLSKLKCTELKALCKKNNIKKYSRMRKNELITVLNKLNEEF